MRIPTWWRRPTPFVALEQEPEVRRLELSPYVYDLLDRSTDELPGAERVEAEQQLRRELLEELFPHAIRGVRSQRLNDIYRVIHAGPPPHALCLSGGGIRSASFSLGVLQAFGRDGWLSMFDYLSTVSGGGYIGGWLSAWIANDGRKDVEAGLGARTTDRLLEPEAPPIRHIRTYANYLSPRLGLLSADTWTLAATYLRNLLLNWLVLVPLLAACALIPWIAVANVEAPLEMVGTAAGTIAFLVALAGSLAGALAVAYTHRTRPDSTGRRDVGAIPKRERSQSAFLLWCLLPLGVAVCLLSTALVWGVRWHLLDGGRPSYIYAASVGAGIHALGFFIAAAFSKWTWRPNQLRKILATAGETALVIVSGAAAGLLAYALIAREATIRNSRLYVWLAAPVFMLLVMGASFIFTGWTSRFATDDEREWSARFAAWILVPVVGWIVIAGLVLFGPDYLRGIKYGQLISGALALVTGGGVAAFGNSTATSAKKASEKSRPTETIEWLPASMLLALGAMVFTALLVVGLSMLGQESVRQATCFFQVDCPPPGTFHTHPLTAISTALALLAVGLLMARLIDTNRFSLHAMYRARLIRTFLGASRRSGERHPDPFTGFDEQDDLPMNTLAPKGDVQRPLHVVNMALNLVGGTNLAWRDRKARSFTVTPLYAGSVGLGFRTLTPSAITARRLYGGQRGVSLGTAMTISGAAASPNMGYHSSPLVTFLMTFFNLRLGWWLGNPGPAGNATFWRSQPTLSVRPIVDELFGRTDDRNHYVYLSDGGHFENLGVYEMVLRRCRRIVVVDASCDGKASFDDLANALRLVSVDLGVPITFEGPFDIRARGDTPPCAAHTASATIDYAAIDGKGAPAGKLYYLKASLTGDEPRDVYSYARSSTDFPHESTTDQFFSETQLEGYRALGEHVAEMFIRQVNTATVGPDSPAARRQLP
jgi:hypothetical protein